MWQEISHSIIGNNNRITERRKTEKTRTETTNRQANRTIGLDRYALFLNQIRK